MNFPDTSIHETGSVSSRTLFDRGSICTCISTVSVQYSKHLMNQTYRISFLIYARVESMELIDREKRISLFLKPFISKERSGRMERIVKERQLYLYNKYLDAAEINRIPNQRDPVSPLEPSPPKTPLLHITSEAQLPDPPSSKLTSTQTSTHPDETILFKEPPK